MKIPLHRDWQDNSSLLRRAFHAVSARTLYEHIRIPDVLDLSFPTFLTQKRTSPSEGGATWIISMAVPIRSAMVRDDDTMDALPVLTAGRIALTTMTAATIAAIVSSAVVRTLSNRSRVLRLGFLSRPLGLLLPPGSAGRRWRRTPARRRWREAAAASPSGRPA